MQRHHSNSLRATTALATPISPVVTPPGFLGVFGQGRYAVFAQPGSYSFVAPATSIRVRVVGSGAGGSGASVDLDNAAGGAGGGYAHGVFSVALNATFAVTVPAGGLGGEGNSDGTPGATASFGALISATGGAVGWRSPMADLATGNAGGLGIGGDFQARGGRGGSVPGSGGGIYGNVGGGGAAGSQLGDGGDGGAGARLGQEPTGEGGGLVRQLHLGGSGGAVGGVHGGIGGGASPFGSPRKTLIPHITNAITLSEWYLGGPDCLGNLATDIALARLRDNPTAQILRFPFDAFTGGACPPDRVVGNPAFGFVTPWRAGPGAGGTGGLRGDAGDGGIGGGGGGKPYCPGGSGTAGTRAGHGGIGGGGGAALVGRGGNGGDGLVIVEW